MDNQDKQKEIEELISGRFKMDFDNGVGTPLVLHRKNVDGTFSFATIEDIQKLSNLVFAKGKVENHNEICELCKQANDLFTKSDVEEIKLELNSKIHTLTNKNIHLEKKLSDVERKELQAKTDTIKEIIGQFNEINREIPLALSYDEDARYNYPDRQNKKSKFLLDYLAELETQLTKPRGAK